MCSSVPPNMQAKAPWSVETRWVTLPPSTKRRHSLVVGEAVGCEACQRTGYRGRLGIYELVPMDAQLQDMIVAGANLNDMKAFAQRQGFRTLFQDGLIKASQGLTTLDEVTRLTLA